METGNQVCPEPVKWLGVCVLLSVACSAGPAASTASISGKVVAEDGSPVANATVIYTGASENTPAAGSAARSAARSPSVSSSVLSAANGTFSVVSLPPGSYGICVSAPGFLYTCNWWRSGGVTLSAAQSADIGVIRLTKGAAVQIRVNDPLHLLPPETTMSSPLIVGVRDGARFDAAHQISSDSGGRTLAVTAPFDTPLQLWVHSRLVTLADESGATVDNRGVNIPFTVTRAAGSKYFTLKVQSRIKN